MRKLLTLLTLIFTVMFSSTSFAEWTEVTKTVDGDTFYVDFERIRKHDGYVYWWTLTDYLKPWGDGVFSYKVYRQGDCKLFRYKYLSSSYYKEPMGEGTGEIFNTPINKDWNYPPMEISLKSVCEYAN